MEKTHIKEEIVKIITSVAPASIVADDIFERLTAEVDPGRTQEEIRGLIKDLVNNDNYLIGSSSKGYFYIDDEEKLATAKSYLTNRIAHLQERADNFERLYREQHANQNP